MTKLISILTIITLVFSSNMANQEDTNDYDNVVPTTVEEYNTNSYAVEHETRVLYFDLSGENAVYSGSVISTMNSCYATYYACTSGSATVEILANGTWRNFTIPSHGTTTIRIPFTAPAGSSISYFVHWNSGGSNGRATGSFTLYY